MIGRGGGHGGGGGAGGGFGRGRGGGGFGVGDQDRRRNRLHRHAEEGLSREELGRRTREDILEAASELFAQTGYEGTSMRELAEASGTSQALIHWHFRKKRDLYEAVQKRGGVGQSEELNTLFTKLSDSDEDLERYISLLMRHYIEHPDAARLSVWSLLEAENDTEPVGLRKEVVTALEKMQEKGQIQGNYSVPFIAALITSVAYLWPLLRDRVRGLLAKEERGEMDNRYAATFLDLLLYGIRGKVK